MIDLAATPFAGFVLPVTILDMSHAGEFLDRFNELYLDSFLANIMVGVLLGSLGLFVVLRRIVFLSAALSQVSGAGLALAFFIGALSAHSAQTPRAHPPAAVPDEVLDNHKPTDSDEEDIQRFLDGDGADGGVQKGAAKKPPRPRPSAEPHHGSSHSAGSHHGGSHHGGSHHAGSHHAGSHPPSPGTTQSASEEPTRVSRAARHSKHQPIRPIFMSLLLTALVALLLSDLSRGQRRSTQESVVGVVFIAASAASIILSQMAEKGAHEIAELLFGTVIFIPPQQQRMIYVVGAMTLALYALLFKDFVFVSFDPTSARASRFPVRLTNGVLFLLIAASIAICTRAVGAMPVFALTVLPATTALLVHQRMGPALFTSGLVGGVLASGGYFLSGLLNLSAGPLMVVVGTVIVATAWLARFLADRLVAMRARRRSEAQEPGEP